MRALEDFTVLIATICTRWGRADTLRAWQEIADMLHGAMLALPAAAGDDAYMLARIAIERGHQ